MEIEFTGKIIFWRGPAPYFFVAVPEPHSRAIKAISARVTYGWGVIPVQAQINETVWTTSLFPKQGLYLVPIKVMVQKAEDLNVDDTVTIRLKVGK